MNASLFAEAIELVDEAEGIPSSARDSFYAQRCRERSELLALVRRIEGAPADSHAPILGDALEEIAVELFPHGFAEGSDPLIGALIDDHLLQSRIGQGGMGRVYRALYIRHHVVVALKVLDDTGGDPADTARRLQREVELLERCQHPAIVRARSSGLLPDGCSYFTMDLVEGQPITAYCASVALGLAERLRLLCEVCEAVQSAHGVGVIHRDLKPSNILVAGLEAQASVRLLDFGIAEAAGEEYLAVRNYLAVAYAPPEQGDAPAPAIDIYALGVLLAELVLGRLPFHLNARGPSALRRSILAQGVQPLRAFHVPEEQPWLTGLSNLQWRELQAICSKATAGAPGDRYATVRELADDLHRFLKRRPVSALALPRNRRALYETWRLVARNQAATAAAALILLLIVGAVTSYIWGLRQSRDAARRMAAQATAHAERMKQLSAGLFLEGTTALSASSTVEDLIDRGTQSASTLNNEPAEQAEFLMTLSIAYEGLGRFQKAEAVLAQAFAIRTRLYGADSAKAAEVMSRQASIDDRESKYQEALALGQRAYAIQERTLPPGDSATIETEDLLASFWTHLGDYPKAVPLLEDVIHWESGNPALLKGLAWALNDLAAVEFPLGHTEHAVELEERAVAINRQILGPRYADVAVDLVALSGGHAQRAQYAQAEAEAREAISIFKEKLPPGDDYIAYAEGSLGLVLVPQSRWAEAQPILEGSLRSMRAEAAPSSSEQATVLRGLGSVYEGEGRLQKALDYFQEQLATYKQLYPTPNYFWEAALAGVASVSLKQHSFVAAERAARQAYEICRDQLPPGSPKTIASEILLGRALVALNRPTDAQPLLQEASRLADAGGQPTAELRPKATQALLELQTARTRALAHSVHPHAGDPAVKPVALGK